MPTVPTTCSALALFTLGSAAFGQNLLVNGDFETPPAGGSFVNRGGASLTGWQVTGNIDHIGGFWSAASGSQSVDLNGSSGATLSQSVQTGAGVRFRLTVS